MAATGARVRGGGAAALLAALLSALAPGAAHGAVEGSPHDLLAQGYDTVRTSMLQERCSRCHLPTSPSQQNLIPEVPPVLQGSYAASSLGCFSCHDGTTIVSPDVDASQSAFHPLSHGTELAGYEGLGTEESGLPYLSGGRMECVTCHDPHDNGHRPFLRAELQELCLACHSKYAEIGRGRENRSGSHVLAAQPATGWRLEVPIKIGAPFQVPFPAPYPPQRAKGAPGVHWARGGHLGGGREGALGCVTCHAVHGDDESPPRRMLLTVEPENDVANLLCEGCHAGERGDAGRSAARPNPGGTKAGRTYHPVDDDAANGEGRIVEVTVPKGWPVGRGEPARLLCTTCHAAHDARPATPLLRPTETAPGFCESCHVGEPPAYHHPVAGTGKCQQQLPPPPEGEPPGMRCNLCHRAHNAGLGAPDEKRFVPLLRRENTADSCSSCHPPENPTCGTRPDYRASHFLGDPLEAYGETEPPLRRDPWPESLLTSAYGPPENRSVTCLSCHSFQRGALVSGDLKKSGHLLARSGNPVEWQPGGESGYLCAGCHSVDPGTGATKGHSHPQMTADAAKLNRIVTAPATITPSGKVNCDSCHRPHEAITRGGVFILESVDGTNTDPRAVRPPIDYTVLCHLCHDPGKY
jgi:predicted CXXCH cytochrome family protein